MSQYFDKLTKPVSLASVTDLLTLVSEGADPVVMPLVGYVLMGIADGNIPATEPAQALSRDIVESAKASIYTALRQSI